MATSVAPSLRGDSDANARAKALLRLKVARLKGSLPVWAGKCYTILDKDRKEVALIFNGVQRAIYLAERAEMREKGRVRQFILKGRQGGVTTLEEAANLHAIWSVKGAACLTLATDRELMDKVFTITTRAMEHFPTALLPPVGQRRIREINFPTRDSSYYTGTASADRAGAGLTLYRFHGTEFAHWEDPAGVLKAVGPSLENDGTTAVLETTGGGYGSDAHNFWKEAKAGGNGYTALFFPWWECDPVKYRLPLLERDELGQLSDDERDLVRRFGLDLEQIKWRRAKMKEYGRDDFLQEYAEDEETCWLSAGGMFYEADILKALKTRTPAAKSTERGGTIEWFIQPKDVKGRCILGGDTAEGSGGGDRFTFTIRQMEGWKLVCKFEDAAIQPKGYAQLVNDVGRRLANPLLVIEKNQHGITVLRHLRDDHNYPVDRIYHRAPLDRPDAQASERIGWATTGESIPLMLDAGRDLLNAAKEGLAGALSESAISDAFAVRRGPTGRISLNGKDVLVSEMLAWIGRSYNIAKPRVTVISV
jgi:hypothetical protein